MLGYFSVIGLLRVHVLLGDFTLALKVMDEVDISQKVRIKSTFWGAFVLTQVFNSVCIYPDHRLRCHDELLRWILLPYPPTLCRCHPHIHFDPQPDLKNEAISYSQLSI